MLYVSLHASIVVETPTEVSVKVNKYTRSSAPTLSPSLLIFERGFVEVATDIGCERFSSEQQGLIIKWKKRGSISLIARCWKPFGHGDDADNATIVGRECKDDLLWYYDIEKFAANYFSMVVV